MHYNSESNAINLPAIVGCLNWIALNSFIGVKHMCQYLHHTLGYALGYVPLSPDAKQKLWVMGDASFAPTGEKNQQGLIVYHGITSANKLGGNLVQWNSNKQNLIAKSTCET